MRNKIYYFALLCFILPKIDSYGRRKQSISVDLSIRTLAKFDDKNRLFGVIWDYPPNKFLLRYFTINLKSDLLLEFVEVQEMKLNLSYHRWQKYWVHVHHFRTRLNYLGTCELCPTRSYLFYLSHLSQKLNMNESFHSNNNCLVNCKIINK